MAAGFLSAGTAGFWAAGASPLGALSAGVDSWVSSFETSLASALASEATGCAAWVSEAAFAAEGNKFHVVASGAGIHGTAKRRIATIQHFIDIFHLSFSGMEGIFNFFIIVGKDSL